MIRGTTNKQVIAIRQAGSGERTSTGLLDGTNTVEIIKIGNPGNKVSFQRSGTLAATVEFSINGTDYQDSAVVNSAAIGSYTTHSITHVRVTRTAGSGKMSVVFSN